MRKKQKTWKFGPFEKNEEPVLKPEPESTFFCPVKNEPVHWEATNVYNPAAIIRNEEIHLIYRADDTALDNKDHFGNPVVTCRLGHAVSKDGVNFVRDAEPVLYPQNDEFYDYEWHGGCQDLHIVESEEGTYYMNYSAWTGEFTDDGFPQKRKPERWEDVLLTASSKDLINWKKHGPAFSDEKWLCYRNHSRSGVVISRAEGDKLIAAKIHGKYWMYMSHKGWLASSDNLLDWDIELNEDGSVKCLFPDYTHYGYANASCEAGAAAIITDRGIVYFFNACSKGDSTLSLDPNAWSLGQALISGEDMLTVLEVDSKPLIVPEYEWEKHGHCSDPAVVCNTMVKWQGKWTLYYGAADRCIAIAQEQSDDD